VTSTPVPVSAVPNRPREFVRSPPVGPPSRSTGNRVGTDPGQWQRVLSGDGSPPRPLDISQLERDIRYYVQQGERAERAGSYQAARVYFNLARNAMSPDLQQRYERVVAARTAEAAARLDAEQEAARKKF